MFDRKKQLLWSKLRVGLVITFALVTLFLTVFFAGSIEDIFSPKVVLKAQIPNVKGLRSGAPVWVSGVEVGSVNNIELHPEFGTLVNLSFSQSALGFIKKDSRASVLTMGLLGDKYIELSTGTVQAGPVSKGDILKGGAQIEFQDIMETSAVSINKLTDLIIKIEKSEGTLAKFITDPEIYNNLKDTTNNLSILVNDVQKSQGTLSLLLKDPTLYQKMVSTMSSLDELSKKINTSNGTLKKLVEDPELYDRLLAISLTLEEFSSQFSHSSGTIKKLVEDPLLYENLSKATLQLSAILENIDKGKGVAGTLVKDEELARELKETVFVLRELTTDIKERPHKYFKFSLF